MWSQESLWGPLKSQNEPCNCNTPMRYAPDTLWLVFKNFTFKVLRLWDLSSDLKLGNFSSFLFGRLWTQISQRTAAAESSLIWTAPRAQTLHSARSRRGRKLDIQNVTEATELVMVPLHWLKVIRVSNLRVVGNEWLIDSIYESPINFSPLESWNWSKVRLDGGWSWMGVGRYVLKNAKKYKPVKNIQSCIVS